MKRRFGTIRAMSRNHQALNRRRWAAARRAALDRDCWRCSKCGLASRLEVDHRQALEDDGSRYSLTNLRTLCRGCHIDRHRKPRPPEVEAWHTLVRELSAG